MVCIVRMRVYRVVVPLYDPHTRRPDSTTCLRDRRSRDLHQDDTTPGRSHSARGFHCAKHAQPWKDALDSQSLAQRRCLYLSSQHRQLYIAAILEERRITPVRIATPVRQYPYHQPTSDTTQARQRLFTLGIILLELLFSNTLVDKLSQSDYTNTVLLCTALTWQRRAEEEFGDGIAEAIRKCIVCAFEPAADLGSAAFILAVWANVVQPLEEFLRAWGRVGTAVG